MGRRRVLCLEGEGVCLVFEDELDVWEVDLLFEKKLGLCVPWKMRDSVLRRENSDGGLEHLQEGNPRRSQKRVPVPPFMR